jgi:hypothetical protein
MSDLVDAHRFICEHRSHALRLALRR